MAGQSLIFVDLIYTPAPEFYQGRWQPWRAMVLNGGNFKPLFMTTEAYTNRQDLIDTIATAFGPNANVYLRESEHGNTELRLATG